MPLLDHFHPPLHGPRRPEGFHHAWATFIAQQLNEHVLPPEYFAESEISVGPELEVDVATMQFSSGIASSEDQATAVWSPSKPKIGVEVEFAHLDTYEIRIYQDLGVKIGQGLSKAAINQIPGRVLIEINKKVGFRLITKAGSKGAVNLMKVVPLAGGIVGGVFDAGACRVVGKQAKNLFLPEEMT